MTHIIAKLHRTDLVICSPSGESLSDRRINEVTCHTEGSNDTAVF